MDTMEFKQLLTQDESDTLEFKRSTAKLKNAAETLCAYLNGHGGIVLLGINDDKKVIGVEVSDNTKQEIANTLKKIEPASNITVKYFDLNNNKKVVALHAHPDKNIVPYTFNGRPFERKESSTQKMSQPRYQQLLLNRALNPQSWDDMPAIDITLQDLDHEEIAKTVNLGVAANRIDPLINDKAPLEILKKLKLVNTTQITNAAVVLFCKEIPTTYFQCLIRMARFRGTQKGHFIDSKQVYGHAFHLLQEAENFLARHTAINSHFEPGRLQRIDKPEYPHKAIREALINAICHRDYTLNTASISLAIYDDKIEITSPGKLPNGVTIDDLKQIHDSNPRNKTIANVLFRRGMVETFGMGTQEMLKACQQYKLPEPEFIERGNTFVVRFRLKPAILNFPSIEELSDRQQEVLTLLTKTEALAARDILATLQNPPAERTLRDDLAKLKELGFIDSSGTGRGTTWSLSDRMRRNEAE